MVKAILKNHRQSPRKVRLVADVIRGKKVADALTILMFTPKKAASSVKKVLESAIANAKNNDNLDEKDLYVKEISVDEGVTLKRWRARARGSAARIRKRTSHIVVTLATKDGKKVVKVEETKEVDSVSDTKSDIKKTSKKEVAVKEETEVKESVKNTKDK